MKLPANSLQPGDFVCQTLPPVAVHFFSPGRPASSLRVELLPERRTKLRVTGNGEGARK